MAAHRPRILHLRALSGDATRTPEARRQTIDRKRARAAKRQASR